MNDLIDSDIHVTWTDPKVFTDYLPKVWQDRFFHGCGHSQRGFALSQPFYNPLAVDQPEGCSQPDELLGFMDRHGIEKSILTNWRAPAVGNFGDHDYPARLAEAFNRWLTEHWLSRSARFFGTIVVTPRHPAMAAAEIRRAAAASSQIVQVSLSPGTLEPYGKPQFRPIFEAAVECGLSICLHAGAEGVGVSNPPSSHGWPRNILEYRVCPMTNFIAHLTSMMTEGVFTDFPDLKLAGFEVGGALPLITYLWRFDKNYKALRSECPWMRELPSALVRKHVRLGTQSSAIGEESLYFRLLESFRADEILLWTSNYPRWDQIDPSTDPHLLRGAPWRRELVARETALAFYPRLS